MARDKTDKLLQMPRLDETAMDPDPLVELRQWLAKAESADFYEPLAMALATASRDGVPSVRTVLLRGFDDRGLVFYTNYDSRKGRELADNPRACLLFYWGELERQVRIEGRVEKTSAEESDAYFRTRPRESQFSAVASPQSRVIASRAELEEKVRELVARYGSGEIPRPANWGGYRVVPEVIEFWQGGPHRLHDRIEYVRQPDGSWQRWRLAP